MKKYLSLAALVLAVLLAMDGIVFGISLAQENAAQVKNASLTKPLNLVQGHTAVAPKPVYTTLSVGSNGEKVTKLTEELKELGYLETATSSYNQNVAWAVRQFQKTNDLESDGVAGKMTQQLLYEGTPEAYSFDVDGLLDYAKTYLGTPYVYGASGSNSFDCSSYTQWVMKAYGITIPRTAYMQAYSTSYPKVTRQELMKGDLIFFDTLSDSDAADHVGIYLGNGEFIHASASSSHPYVVISNLNGFYGNVFSWGIRVL